MMQILLYFLIAFSFTIYCEQRHILFARVKKEEFNSSLSVIYEDVNSVLLCGATCFIDTVCDGFGFNTNSKHCFGVHGFESEGYSYQPVSSISEEVFWYRPGNKYLNTCNFMHFEENDNNLLKNSNNQN